MKKWFDTSVIAEVMALHEEGYTEKHIAGVLRLGYKDVRIIVRDYQNKSVVLDKQWDEE